MDDDDVKSIRELCYINHIFETFVEKAKAEKDLPIFVRSLDAIIVISYSVSPRILINHMELL